MADLMPLLAAETGRPIVNRTNFGDRFSFYLQFRSRKWPNLLGAQIPINEALREQVGLVLEDARTNVEAWVIERAEKPSEN